jgi:uncharacterized protein (TIGR02246 family)
MRTLATVTLIGCVALVAPAAHTQDEGGDEAAVQTAAQKWIEAWNAGDMAGVAALYTEDADYEDVFGERHEGRAAIEQAFAEINSGPYQGAQLELESISLRFMSPTVAVSDTRWKMTGMPEGDGPAAPAEGLSTAVFVAQGDQWLITAHRSRVPYTPPAP